MKFKDLKIKNKQLHADVKSTSSNSISSTPGKFVTTENRNPEFINLEETLHNYNVETISSTIKKATKNGKKECKGKSKNHGELILFDVQA